MSRGAKITLVLLLVIVLAAVALMGPLLGGVLSDLFGWRATFIAMALAFLAICALLVPEARASGKPQKTCNYGRLRLTRTTQTRRRRAVRPEPGATVSFFSPKSFARAASPWATPRSVMCPRPD